MKFTFVLPRFGAGIVGGAERLVGEIAERLASRGDEITILSTCAIDNRTWENALPSGVSIERGMTVHRFPVDERDLEIWIPRQIHISEGRQLPIEEQLLWLEHGVNSTALYEWIVRNGAGEDALFFAPYLFGTTFWGALIHPERSILIPCLHDESYAYLEAMVCMFRSVRGAVFNAEPERELATRLYGTLRGGAVGMGFEPRTEADIAALKPFFGEPFPYVIYLGRKETGKNAHLLVDAFIAGKETGAIPSEVKLVIAGGGDFSDIGRPAALSRSDIVDLPAVSEEEKSRLLKHALALVQLSENESFSIVLMESWLVGTPVIVSDRCAVTKSHAIESGGGLPVRGVEELSGAIAELARSPELSRALGAAGAAYVKSEYAWPSVLRRFDTVVADLLGTESHGVGRAG